MAREPSFSLQDFKKWLGEHTDETDIFIVNDGGLKPGEQVLVRLSESNMINKLRPLNEDKRDFKRICMFLIKKGVVPCVFQTTIDTNLRRWLYYQARRVWP